MSQWTAKRTTESTVSLLGDARLILVSNREPYSHRWHRQALAASGVSELGAVRTTGWDGSGRYGGNPCTAAHGRARSSRNIRHVRQRIALPRV